MTPDINDIHVQKLIKLINTPHKPYYVKVKSISDGQINDCFFIVENKVKESGGKSILGWYFGKSKILAEAVCHAIWETPNGEIIDITPKTQTTVDKILFVRDDSIQYVGKQIDNIRLNITENALVDDFIFVCKAIFDFENKGDRAFSLDLDKLLDDNQKNHLKLLKSFRYIINELLKNDGNRDSLCPCNSGLKFFKCHGDNFKEITNQIR